ncbi:MAG: hypothetical protein NTY08_01575 [Proteobacteria bacterium]|nr:hypothetical protein [Pseudomonadota bacterium]
MAMQKLVICWKAALVFAVSFGGMTACSSNNTDEDALAPSAEGEGEAPVASEAAADDQAQAAPATGVAGASAEQVASAAAANVAAPVDAAADGQAGAAAPIAGQVASAPAEKSRVVRHVKVKLAQLRAEPSASAKSVGRLVRGDRILVDLEKGWGRIGDGIYIKLSDTAAKPVAAKRRPSEWMPPAH